MRVIVLAVSLASAGALYAQGLRLGTIRAFDTAV